MTLRKLTWMCAEKKRVMGELAAWHLAGVALLMPFVNAKLNVQQINPYKGETRQSSQVEAVRAFIAARGLAALAGSASNQE